MPHRIILIALLSLCTLPSFAQNDTMVTASVNATKVGIMQTVEVRFECNVNIKHLTPPPFNGFDIKQGPYQTTQKSTTFLNGKTTHKEFTSLTYILQPKHTGILTIGEAKVTDFLGKEYYSYPISIEVITDSIPGITSYKNISETEQPFADMMRILSLPVKGNQRFIIGVGPVFYEKGVTFDTVAFLTQASKLKDLPDFKFKSNYSWNGSIKYVYPELPRLYFGIDDTTGIKEKIEPYYSIPGASYYTGITPTEKWDVSRELNLLYSLHNLCEALDNVYDPLSTKPSTDNGERQLIITIGIPDKRERNAFIKQMKKCGYKTKYDDPEKGIEVSIKVKYSKAVFLQHAIYILEQSNKYSNNSWQAFSFGQ